jgi:Amt family ammonium transporter
MAERAKLWVYFAFGAVFTVIYSVVSHWVWHADGWLYGLGMQDFAGSTVVHYQGALAALAGALLLGARIGRFGDGRRSLPIAGHNLPYAVIGTIILWFGWFGFNAGSTLALQTGADIGYFAYIAMVTNLGAAAGGLGGILVSWALVHRKPDLSMLLNGVLAALVAVTAACGFVAPWAAILIGFVAGGLAVWGVQLVARMGIDDPIGAVAVHGLAGVWGTLATGIFAAPALAENLAVGQGGLIYTGDPSQLGVQALGLVVVGAFTFGTSYAALWAMKRAWGIRVDERTELDGLDMAEHGAWGYPEFAVNPGDGSRTELARPAHAGGVPIPQPA